MTRRFGVPRGTLCGPRSHDRSRRHPIFFGLAWLAASFVVLGPAGATGCHTLYPARAEGLCAKKCRERATSCSARQCYRGCNLVLDRLIERQRDTVVDCVAGLHAPCDDGAWAYCAVRFGPHQDGGPPAPGPPSDGEDDDDPPPAKAKSNDDEAPF